MVELSWARDQWLANYHHARRTKLTHQLGLGYGRPRRPLSDHSGRNEATGLTAMSQFDPEQTNSLSGCCNALAWARQASNRR
jgi:hypothetical protein